MAYAPTETVIVEFADATVEESETVVVPSDVVMLGLLGDAERPIVPEKVPRALTVIVETEVEPLAIVKFGGVDRSSKLGR